MEIYQLRAFVTAARLGNLTRTAEALHLTQPAITGQIKALEEGLGVTLFERRPGGISLTRSGELLLPEAEQVLNAAGRLQGRARELQGQVAGHLVVGIPTDPESLRLGSTLAWLAEQYATSGRSGDARALMRRLCSLTNDLGLLSEEYDPVAKRQVGNFPQAFSHLALVRAADALAGVGRRPR